VKTKLTTISRPSATIFSHDQVDRRIDILGYSKEFFVKMFSRPTASFEAKLTLTVRKNYVEV